jgi:hypothetical protein
MHAFFAEGVDKMYVQWAVEGLPTLLHLSLFFFFGRLTVFLFNVNCEVFSYVIGWIRLFSLVYGLIMLLPIIRHNSPYYSPLSTPVWFLYASICLITFKILDSTMLYHSWSNWDRKYWEGRYQGWMREGVDKVAEDTMSDRSSICSPDIDIQILDWTVSALLGDDISL